MTEFEIKYQSDPEHLHLMSWGGGVQSTALLMLCEERHPELMEATDGRVPDVWIFADTGDEPEEVYDHVKAMRPVFRSVSSALKIVKRPDPLSVHAVGRAMQGKRGISMPPMYVETKDGGSMPVRRGCTADFKVKQIETEIGRVRGDRHVVHWLGISHDEFQRMKTSAESWRTFFHPLVAMGWDRARCLHYLESRGIEAPRSACHFCPFHSASEWRRVRAMPEEWAKVVQFERLIHQAYDLHGHVAGLQTKPYLHPSRVPIDEAPINDDNLDLFGWGDECAGVCGV